MVRSEGFLGLRVETEHLKEKTLDRQAGEETHFLLNGSSTQYTEHIANKAHLNSYYEC